MRAEARFKHLIRNRRWSVTRLVELDDRHVAAVCSNGDTMVAKMCKGAGVMVYHGTTALRMLHPRVLKKFKQFLTYSA